MGRAISYSRALDWIVRNDDTQWVLQADSHPSVTASLLADIYGKTDEQVRDELAKLLSEKTLQSYKDKYL